MSEEKKEENKDVYDSLKELTKAVTDVLKEIQEFKETFKKHVKAGRF